MAYTTLSEKFQVVIPKQVRSALGLKAKEKLVVWQENGVIEMVPIKGIKNPLTILSSLSKKKIPSIPIEKLEKEIEEGLTK